MLILVILFCCVFVSVVAFSLARIADKPAPKPDNRTKVYFEKIGINLEED